MVVDEDHQSTGEKDLNSNAQFLPVSVIEFLEKYNLSC